MKSFIKDCDNLGIEASLYYHKDDKIVKSILGGLLSIIIMLLILSGGGYFFYQFATRESFTLVSNSAMKSDIDYKEFSTIPFMARLSGRDFKLYPEGYYYIEMRAFNTEPGSSQTFKDYKMEPCDINKCNLATKKELFSAINDVDTYFCPVYNDDKIGLRGIYGSTDYSFALIRFYFCVNDEAVGRANCADYEEIKKAFGGTFLDFITITNSIDHYSSIPYQEKIYQARIPSSSTIFKRIWLYYQRTIYKTDYGYLFESIHSDMIFSIKDYTADIDLREFDENYFLVFTFVNHENTITYTKSYMKAPTLLANIGGIIKGLTLIGYILNYPIAINLFNLSLINTIYDKENSFTKVHQKSTFPHSTVRRVGIENNEIQKHNEDKVIFKKININSQSINIGDTINNHLISIQNASHSLKKNNLNFLNNNYIDNNIINKYSNSNTNKIMNKRSNSNVECLEKGTKINIIENRPNSDLNNNDYRLNKNKENNYTKNTTDKDKRNNIIYKRLPSIKKSNSLFINNQQLNQISLTTEDTILARNIFKLSCLNMLDPFQTCLNKKKKEQYLRRLRKAEECLNINNLITNFQELSLIKKILLEENQLILLDNLNRLNPDIEKIITAYNNIISKEYQINKIQSSLSIKRERDSNYVNNENIYNNSNINDNEDCNSNNYNINNKIYDDKFTKSYIEYNNNKTLDEKNFNSKLINLIDF